jgi:DNA-binding LacI/PurR family transcriptional regulator
MKRIHVKDIARLARVPRATVDRALHGRREAFQEFFAGGKVREVVENHESQREAFQKCVALLKRVR